MSFSAFTSSTWVEVLLKRFYTLSALARFDDRSTQAESHAEDKLVTVKELWNTWSALLLAMYMPEPEVTLDERLDPSERVSQPNATQANFFPTRPFLEELEDSYNDLRPRRHPMQVITDA
ncbi:hypothetical protein CRENBAI_011673 [Crenichthys baileyi]|uniref:Uncharacterized protein n=1 Tax=Crenichthys baileyi TaxID=28760 RepID=A0AAV9SBU7_9TELE